jgi:hypothetical protein
MPAWNWLLDLLSPAAAAAATAAAAAAAATELCSIMLLLLLLLLRQPRKAHEQQQKQVSQGVKAGVLQISCPRCCSMRLARRSQRSTGFGTGSSDCKRHLMCCVEGCLLQPLQWLGVRPTAAAAAAAAGGVRLHHCHC